MGISLISVVLLTFMVIFARILTTFAKNKLKLLTIVLLDLPVL